jgi:hypothetical protein
MKHKVKVEWKQKESREKQKVLAKMRIPMPVRTCKTQQPRVEKTKDNEGMNKTRMEGEGKQREAEGLQNCGFGCVSESAKSEITIGNEKHNEECRIEAERKPREAENFRQNGDSHACQRVQSEIPIGNEKT